MDNTGEVTRTLSLKEQISPWSHKGIEACLKHTGLEAKQFEGKTIVNMGAGGDDYGKELKIRGIEATVVNVDIKYPPGWGAKPPSEAVKADMLKLPIKDNTVDMVVSGDALSRWLPKKMQIEGYKEGLRVLKPGGEMHVWTHRWVDSVKPEVIVQELQGLYSNCEIRFDRNKSVIFLKKNSAKCKIPD